MGRKRLALALMFEERPGGNSCNVTIERKRPREEENSEAESSRAIQIGKARTAVKYSCAGSHSEFN